MKTIQTLKAAALVALGLGCAVAAFTVKNTNVAGSTEKVVVGSITTATGETMPVVTITAKRLTTTQKAVLAMRDVAHGSGRKHG